MEAVEHITIRPASAGDAPAVAWLHADNWRRHYRGAYSDSYLDGDLDADRLAVWTDRLADSDPDRFTLAAVAGRDLVGFAHVVLDADPVFGALLDNLHVRDSLRGGGVGTRLLAAVARETLARRPQSGLYLWVLEQNTAAQVFYRARAGTFGDRALTSAPGGKPENLNGAPAKVRVRWPDPTVLLA